VKLNPGAHMRCIRFLSKTGCDRSGIRAVLTVGRSLVSNGHILRLILLSNVASACLLFKNCLFLDYITIISSLTSCLPHKCVAIFETPSCFKVTHSIFLNILYLALSSFCYRWPELGRPPARAPVDCLIRSSILRRCPEQEEPVQPEDAHVFVEVDDDDDNYYSYYRGGWVDTDTEEELMELPDDHPDAARDSDEGGTAGGDGADPDTARGDDAKDGGDDPAAQDGGGDDPNDDLVPAAAADVPPPEPHYEKQIHHLEFAKGPFPAFLWRAMQRIGFPLMLRYEASLFKNAQREEE
jgi:hypothetical protein